MGFHSLVNTAYFSDAAREWKKNGGAYTRAPRGSKDYFQYWEEADRRCTFGYSVGDLWIPGRMYFYLNYFPISRVPEALMMQALEERRSKGRISLMAIEKKVEFPGFWEIAYEWWNFKHIAWYGGEFMGIKSPGNKHICTLKTRGAGFSYWEACDGVYNYNFIPGSKSYYFAAGEPYLMGDAIMDKVQAGLDWINQYSPYWKQNRQVKKTLMHQKASYIDSGNMERGSFSEIIAQIVDKPGKTRGKRGRKATFEEAGSFPNLEAAVEVSLGSMSEGSMYVGQVTIGGTGGEQGPSLQGLENIFDNPESWDMLAFPNIYDDGFQNTTCGYFVPCWRADLWHMDADYNVDMVGALKTNDLRREKKKRSKKPKDLDRFIAEYPRNPREALTRLTGNGFNQDIIRGQIKRLESSKDMQAMLRYGEVIPAIEPKPGEPAVIFVPKPKHIARPIEDFPHSDGDNLDGCVTILQRPYEDGKGKVPPNLYLVTFDAFYKEESEDLTSLYSIKVWKMDNSFSTSFINLPVAWFSGRRKRYEEHIEILFMLAEMYNAEVQGEISGGGQAVVTHAKTNRILHKLKNEPEMAHNKELASKSAGNSFLMNMPPERKKMGMTYLEDWHVKPRGVDENGNKILNVHQIYDIAWLREMLKHDPLKGNYDRISDALIAMFELKEHYAQFVKQRKQARKFYNRELYGSEAAESVGYTTAY